MARADSCSPEGNIMIVMIQNEKPDFVSYLFEEFKVIEDYRYLKDEDFGPILYFRNDNKRPPFRDGRWLMGLHITSCLCRRLLQRYNNSRNFQPP